MTQETDIASVGRVVGLWRYPVKSMAADELDNVDVSWHGLQGDRRWAFVRNNAVKSGFPWFTLRERNDMNKYIPRFDKPAEADTSNIKVQTPAGDIYDIYDPSLGLALSSDGAQVIRQNRGVFDTFPISLITTQTLATLSEMVGDELDALRFRPNILIDTGGDSEFPEDEWVGKTLRIGSMRMRVDQRDARCVVITIDPETGERNPAILQTVADQRQRCLGVYGTAVKPASIALNDKVELEN